MKCNLFVVGDEVLVPEYIVCRTKCVPRIFLQAHLHIMLVKLLIDKGSENNMEP